MNILDLISNETGNHYKYKASTRGGEYSGPCPFCPGGKDRFSILPAEERYVCRRCRQAGSSITFIMKYKSLTFRKAQAMAVEMGIPVDLKYKQSDKYSSAGPTITPWEPREDTTPSQEWQTKAQAYLFQTYKYLLSSNPEAKEHRRWLNARGLSNNLIKKARLGWNLSTATFSRESWGLTLEKNQDGKNKQIWIPTGLVIPYFCNGELIRLRIRQDNPIGSDRFIMVPGSSMNYFDYRAADPDIILDPVALDLSSNIKKIPVMPVEAELDGWVLHDQAQATGVDLHIFGIGNSSTRPNQAAHNVISGAPKVHACLDSDKAGDVETIWWRSNFIRCVDSRIPSSAGKDPGEAFEAGFDFAGWLRSITSPAVGGEVDLKTGTQADLDTDGVELFYTDVLADDEVSIPPDIVLDPVAVPQIDQPNTQPIQSPTRVSPAGIQTLGKACLHGYRCNSAKDNVCLRTKKNFFNMEECPDGQWYKIHNGDVTQVILGFNFKRRKRA